MRCDDLVCLQRCVTAETELLTDNNKEVRPSLASAISNRDTSMAVEVRTAMTCSGGMRPWDLARECSEHRSKLQDDRQLDVRPRTYLSAGTYISHPRQSFELPTKLCSPGVDSRIIRLSF